LKPARANGLQDPILKIPNTKRAGGVAQGIGPKFKPQYHKKKKKSFLLILINFGTGDQTDGLVYAKHSLYH
jgi:hypothetical protein